MFYYDEMKIQEFFLFTKTVFLHWWFELMFLSLYFRVGVVLVLCAPRI